MGQAYRSVKIPGVGERRYIVGERVLASRAEDGQGHEEATVVDYYVLLTEGDSIPSIVVDFDDGERKYMTAGEPDILPLPEEDDDGWNDAPHGETLEIADAGAAVNDASEEAGE
jgi:hypothetical protein